MTFLIYKKTVIKLPPRGKHVFCAHKNIFPKTNDYSLVLIFYYIFLFMSNYIFAIPPIILLYSAVSSNRVAPPEITTVSPFSSIPLSFNF